MNSFFSELKQWRVYRLAVSYAAAAWLILQLTIAVREPLGLPAWTLPAMIGVLMVGFSVALWVGWLQDHRTVRPDGRPIPRSRRHHFAVAVISLIPSLAVAAVFLLLHRPVQANGGASAGRPPAGAVSGKSIAVLPFDSLSADTDNAFFAHGIQEEIRDDLGKVADLKVISHTSVQTYNPGRERNLSDIGRELGVAHLLEGSVERAAGRVRVRVQLDDVASGRLLWSEHYDETLTDVFAIQSRIAKQIVGSLKAQLSPDEKRAIDARATDDLEAYDLYLRAKELLGGFQAQGDYSDPLFKALRLLDAAVARDRTFALAYCLAAKAHDQLHWLGFDHTTARLAREEAAVAEALRLKPALGEANLARAMLLYHGSHAFQEALDELAVARRALPNSVEVLMAESFIERAQGRWDEAVRNQVKAISLDPRNGDFYNDLIVTYDALRMYREEEGVADAGLAAVPEQAGVFRLFKAQINYEMGQPGKCRSLLAALPADYDPNGGATFTRVLVALADQNFAEATQVLAAAPGDKFADLGGTRRHRAWLEALIARAAGQNDRAKAALLTTRALVETDARGQPEEAETLSLLGRIDAGLGRSEAAWREGRRAVELNPVSANAMYGPAQESALALIYAWTGETEQALRLLGPLCTNPGGPSFGELRFDPAWNALRGNPRFEQLVAALEPK